MGFLDFLKKKETQNGAKSSAPVKNNENVKITFTETINGKTSEVSVQSDETFQTDFEHLTEEGELPWGWVTRNKAFTEKIQSEYSYFLNVWLDSRKKAPMEQYSALKSFVMYLEDAERLCKSKGECFEWWFYNDLVSKEYIQKRKTELNSLISCIKEKS